MDVTEILQDLQANGVTVRTDGRFLELEPPEKVTSELIERLRQHKPQIIEVLKRKQRREKVLRILADNPDIKRAFVTDAESDRHNVILTLGIRNTGTCEMLISKHKYDPFAVLEIIQKSGIQ